jgi:sugar phosphate isomerase/epimerase
MVAIAVNTDRTRPVRLSLAQLTVADANPLQLIDAAVAGGFDAICLRLVAPLPTDTVFPVVGQDAMIRDIANRLDATGIQVLDMEAVWLMPHTDVRSLVPAIELAAQFGAQHVLVVGNDPDQGRLAANFAALCDSAQAVGLGIILEAMSFAELKTLRQALDLLRRVRKPNARLLVDALHFYRSGAHPRDLAGIDPSLFPFMHLCDAPLVAPNADGLKAEARGGRFYPGEGELALGDLLRALPVSIPIEVEAPCARYAGLPMLERARICGAATRALLSGVFGRAAPQRAQ